MQIMQSVHILKQLLVLSAGIEELVFSFQHLDLAQLGYSFCNVPSFSQTSNLGLCGADLLRPFSASGIQLLPKHLIPSQLCQLTTDMRGVLRRQAYGKLCLPRFGQQSGMQQMLENLLGFGQAEHSKTMTIMTHLPNCYIHAQASGNKLPKTLQDSWMLLPNLQIQRGSCTPLLDVALCIEKASEVLPAARASDRRVVFLQSAQLGFEVLSVGLCLRPLGRQQQLLLLGDAVRRQELSCVSRRLATSPPQKSWFAQAQTTAMQRNAPPECLMKQL